MSHQTSALLVWTILACSEWALSAGQPSESQLLLSGDYSFAGLFPLHSLMHESKLPDLTDCNTGQVNMHGFHLLQAMRFAVEQINNGTTEQDLLPNVTLGYRMYDICCVQASMLVTVKLVAEQIGEGHQEAHGDRALGVVGPDSSSFTFVPAAALGSFLVPQISYEASDELLSYIFLYPSFFRTIPNDKNQVTAILQLLVRFNWTWVALLGSNNDYGLQGMQSLSQQASEYGICIAYQEVIPGTQQEMQDTIEKIVVTKVNVIIMFSSKRIVSNFFAVVIEQNITDKVWIGTEDWSTAGLMASIPGIATIGSVVGLSVESAILPGFREFEAYSMRSPSQSIDTSVQSNATEELPCLQNSVLSDFSSIDLPMDKHDMSSSFSVYGAVYALAHALHLLLECNSGKCLKVKVEPWQLLQKLKEVRFSIENISMYFDEYGDPPTGYDIVTWDWTNGSWSVVTVGSYTPNPPVLELNVSKIKWNSDNPNLLPVSVCSPECPPGYKRMMTGQHKCCFDCQACPSATFLNKSDPTNCEDCELDKWAPPESEECLDRTIIFLSWEDPISICLLLLLAFTLLVTLGTTVTFVLHMDTPVVKSAGGRTCLLMLGALLGAASSALCHFGLPTGLACLFKQSLFTFTMTVCLACIAVRAFQVVCIFKFSSKLPRVYESWARNRGPQAVILLISVMELLVSVLRLGLDAPQPSRDYHFYEDSIILDCSQTLSPGAMVELGFVAILSTICFCFSYMGKDLPANYNEAKCITFSLMIYTISWISFFTMYSVDRSKYTMALYVCAIQTSVLGILSGYFFPKVYIILLKPRMNTTAHFQNCIQMYTMSKT